MLKEQPDLTLRLSLGGISKENSLTRSSSVIGLDEMGKQPCSFLSLARSSSLPAAETSSDQLSPNLCPPIQPSFSQTHPLEGHGSVDSRKGSSLELNERDQQQLLVTSQTIMPSRNAAKRARVSKGLMERDAGLHVMRTMPSVSTIGDGPNGRKVEGLLYKYKKGQVCIVCVCHGSFLTPAEFVKHAGGTEVANPMKHIHVYCTSYSL